MTNKQAKKEAIKKAYGDKWQLVKSLTPNRKESNDAYDLYQNGYFNTKRLKLTNGCVGDFFDFDFFDFDGKYITPLSIIGLHKNNGWIRIEPDGSNLPKDDYTGSFKTIRLDGLICDETISGRLVNHRFKNALITHHKPIEPELKPIY